MTRETRRRPSLKLEEVTRIRQELDAALIPLARKHSLTVSYLLRLASTGGSASA